MPKMKSVDTKNTNRKMKQQGQAAKGLLAADLLEKFASGRAKTERRNM